MQGFLFGMLLLVTVFLGVPIFIVFVGVPILEFYIDFLIWLEGFKP